MARPVKHDGGLLKHEGSKFWWMQYRDKSGKRQRKSIGTQDWNEGQQRLRGECLQARDKTSLSSLRRGQCLAVSEWADFYLENFSRPPLRAASTHEANRRAVKHISKVFGDVRLADLSADDIELYLRQRLRARVLTRTRALNFLHFDQAAAASIICFWSVWMSRDLKAGCWCVYFLAKKCDQVETRRAARITSPFGQLRVGCAALRAKSLEGSQQQGAVGGHGEDWLFGD